jgi:UDP:flavonoid glycosyltransferase YjiC (YdhE family)
LILFPQKTILIVPLNWGIGHASRCIPIVHALLAMKQRVVLAADGAPLALLRSTFPALPWLHFPSHEPHYGKGKSVVAPLLAQAPALLWQLVSDHRKVEQLVKECGADAVISDNRFGAYSSKVPSLFITHQVHLHLPKGMGWATKAAKVVNNMVASRYSACWIPDFGDERSLAGDLSHPPFQHLPTKYIGPLSRFATIEDHMEPEVVDLLVMLSGPEPQRSIFEKEVLKQLDGFKGTVVIARAVPQGKSLPGVPKNVLLFNHIDDVRLKRLLLGAKTIVARAGYSTIMDLVALQRTALLVPTPGQSEQEYLGSWLGKKGYFMFAEQHNFDLRSAPMAGLATAVFPPFASNSLRHDLAQWLALG